MTRMKKCPTCHGAGKVHGHAGYPGSQAYRPQRACATCGGQGQVPVVAPTPERHIYRVRVEVLFQATGPRHADRLAQEFVLEALSAMQYNGSLDTVPTVIRDPATAAETP